MNELGPRIDANFLKYKRKNGVVNKMKKSLQIKKFKLIVSKYMETLK